MLILAIQIHLEQRQIQLLDQSPHQAPAALILAMMAPVMLAAQLQVALR